MTDRIKEWDEYFGTHCDLPASAIRDLFDEIERLKRRIEELENGACRFNCRTQREAFMAGYLAGVCSLSGAGYGDISTGRSPFAGLSDFEREVAGLCFKKWKESKDG